MILRDMIDINEILKLTQGQGHKIVSQGQICKFANNLFRPYDMNQLLDIDYTYAYDW